MSANSSLHTFTGEATFTDPGSGIHTASISATNDQARSGVQFQPFGATPEQICAVGARHPNADVPLDGGGPNSPYGAQGRMCPYRYIWQFGSGDSLDLAALPQHDGHWHFSADATDLSDRQASPVEWSAYIDRTAPSADVKLKAGSQDITGQWIRADDPNASLTATVLGRDPGQGQSGVRTLSLISAPVFMTEEDKKSSLAGYPDRETALRSMGSRGWLEASNAGRRFPADTDPRMLAWTLDEMGASDTEVLIAMFKCVSNVNLTDLLPKIKAPVLGLYPQQGVIVTDEHTELLRTRVPNCRVVRIPSKAHSLQMVQPAMCAQEVLHFASQHDGIACHE